MIAIAAPTAAITKVIGESTILSATPAAVMMPETTVTAPPNATNAPPRPTNATAATPTAAAVAARPAASP